MTRPAWRTALREKITSLKKRDPACKIAIVGVGHELRGDDAVGTLTARVLQHRLASTTPASLWQERLLVLDAGSAPENSTGVLRRFGPDLILLIDAADMGEKPGCVRCVDLLTTSGFDASTHSIPLNMLAKFLAHDLGCEVLLLGIQPTSTTFGAAPTPKVDYSGQQVAVLLSRIAL